MKLNLRFDSCEQISCISSHTVSNTRGSVRMDVVKPKVVIKPRCSEIQISHSVVALIMNLKLIYWFRAHRTQNIWIQRCISGNSVELHEHIGHMVLCIHVYMLKQGLDCVSCSWECRTWSLENYSKVYLLGILEHSINGEFMHIKRFISAAREKNLQLYDFPLAIFKFVVLFCVL